jgi:hypothetical protein
MSFAGEPFLQKGLPRPPFQKPSRKISKERTYQAAAKTVAALSV